MSHCENESEREKRKNIEMAEYKIKQRNKKK